ncbi:MAG: hypothetical protein AAGM22_30480 [Acidobacteriota bacterium]
MKAKKYLLYTVLGAGSALALGATVLDAGVSRAEEPAGVKLRQESAQSRGFFHAYRSHRGGGLRGGK